VARFPFETAATSGRQMWLQILVNDHPEILDRKIADASGGKIRGAIEWRSPRREDAWAEYRDQAFLDLLGLRLTKRSLADFWPAGGPRWDALGCAKKSVLLVEAMSRFGESDSDCQAGPGSLKRIRDTLAEVQAHYGVRPPRDWTKGCYQAANRIGHLYLLREVNRIPAWLVRVYFVGDETTTGPKTEKAWSPERARIRRTLGLAAAIPGVLDVHVDVRELVAAGTGAGRR
jgi:hypothetical protein